MLITLVPMIIYNGGIFTYYGDFNSQEIPFTYHVNEEIRAGNIFGFDWGTDLGSDLFTAYSFYNTGSMFFYLTLLLPQSCVLYAIPFLLALKTAVAALSAYCFAKRFLKTDSASFIAAMLYAFSGAQCYNLFFYHFHDAAAFFPLLLLALEQYVNDGRRLTLALTVALCAFTNYYFFISEGVFSMIYLAVRCIYRRDGFDITLKKFFGIVLECLLGILIASVLLLPSALAIMNNPRLGENLSGIDLAVYSDTYRPLRIIQSFFMMPDPPARSNLFSPDNANWASIAGYLPMFSMAGVIAFLRCKKKSFLKALTAVLFVFALIPILNSAFQLFNTTYYARWFYSFSLITAVMTAYCFDRPEEVDIKKGVIPTAVGILFFAVLFFLPSKDSDGKTVFFEIAEYNALFVLQIALTVALFLTAIIFIYYVNHDGVYLRRVAGATAVCCGIFLAANVYYGISQGPYPYKYLDSTVNADIKLPESDDFYRIETSENTDNYPMIWGYSTMRCFNTNVSTSIMDFYISLGMTRDVASRIDTEYTSLRSLLSVRYYLDRIDDDDENDFSEKGFSKIDTQSEFKIYENENYLPMGLLYDTYITKDEFESYSTYQKCQLLMYAVVLDKNDCETFSSTLSELDKPKTVFNTYSLSNICKERRENSCENFEYSPYGFSASINAEKGGLVLFSVPYDKGFSAYVNGSPTEIIKADNGLMAVYVGEGESEIRFTYLTYGLVDGVLLSGVGVIGFAIYAGVVFYTRRKQKCI